ncbi:MAG: TspO/MBR family protein [Bacteroidota bacterium]
MNKPSLTVKLIICILGCVALGSVGGIATASSIDTWYANINKPSFNPPNWLFAPVWTTLFTLMGVALALVWHEGPQRSIVKKGITFFGIQFGLNMLWSWLFFGAQQPLWAFVEIIILWVFIFLTIRTFFNIRAVSGWLMVPYLLWVSFAAILNFAIWQLN